MRFTAEISCFETAYDAENGKQRLLQRHFEADEASETVVVAAIRGKLVSSLSVWKLLEKSQFLHYLFRNLIFAPFVFVLICKSSPIRNTK